MSDAIAAHYAKEAERLLSDQTLLSAFSTVYQAATEELVTVDASDTVKVLRLQAKAQVVDEVLTALKSAIIALGESDKPATS